MSKITSDTVVKLAALSKLQLSSDEIDAYVAELQAIFEYIERLDTVDIAGLKPTFQVTGLVNQMREDEQTVQKAPAQSLLAIVPRRHNDYIKVRRMI